MNLLNGTEGGTGGALIGEALEKMRQSAKKRWSDLEYKERMRKIQKKYAKTPEGFKKNSEAGKKSWKNAPIDRHIKVSKIQKIVQNRSQMKKLKSESMKEYYKNPNNIKKKKKFWKNWSTDSNLKSRSLAIKNFYNNAEGKLLASKKAYIGWETRRKNV